jgi:hypothetical protein
VPLTLTEALERATAGAAASASRAVAARARADLASLAEQRVDIDLAVLATQREPGPVALLGADVTAAAYPALLWNGERFERLGVAWATRLALVALTSAGAEMSGERLGAAIEAGVAVQRLWPPPLPAGAVAELTTDAVSAAVCAAAAIGHTGPDLAGVAELAAGLMLAGPAVGTSQLDGLQAGHSLAAGWLAVQLHLCGVLAAPGTAEEVLSTREAP